MTAWAASKVIEPSSMHLRSYPKRLLFWIFDDAAGLQDS